MPIPLMKYKQITPDEIMPYLLDRDWNLQQKVDGIRARLHVNSLGARVLGNNGGPLVSTTAAPVVRQIMKFGLANPHGTYTLEGEIVDGTWWLFDKPLVHVPWQARLNYLYQFFFEVPMPDFIRILPTAITTADKLELWKSIEYAGVEGAVLKHVKGFFEDSSKRSSHVLKCKLTHTVDAFVVDEGGGNGKNGTNNWIEFAVFDENDRPVKMGRCSTIGKPYAGYGTVIEVKYLYVGAGGKLVQPTHLRNRPDKSVKDCDMSQLHFVSKEVVL